MMKRFMGGMILLLAAPAFATVPLTITVSPHGAGLLDNGTSSVTLTAACTYSVSPFSDNCAAAGTITWASHDTGAVTVTSGGVATWSGRTVTGGGGSGNYPNGTFMATAAVSATVAGACNGSATVCTDYMTIQGQHAGDNWQVLVTPSVGQYNDPASGGAVNLTLAIGTKAAVGAGFDLNGGGSGNPTYTCNWSSSNSGVVSIDRDGFALAVSPGTATMTCNQSGNAVLTGGTLSIPITATALPTGTPKTWHILPGGGTPYSATNTAGQCDGVHNATYASVGGTGTNQPCGFGDFEYLYFDQVTHQGYGWLPSGIDTVIVHAATGGTVYHTSVISMGSYIPTNCAPDISDCELPSPPIGLKIYGENYLTCTGDHGPDTTKTVLLSSYGRMGMNLQLSQNVDIECLEIGPQGSGQSVAYGIKTSALTAGITLKNVFIHGTSQGIFGSWGVGNTLDHFYLRGGSSFGINTDDAPYSQSNISFVSGFNLQHSTIEFTGCTESYPAVGPVPFATGSCNDTNTNPTGSQDAIGTANSGGDWVINDTIIRYAFQDGLDLLHSHGHSLTVTNSQFYGNDGQQAKLGPFDNNTFRQNTVVGNCNRILEPFNGVTIANVGGSPAVAGCRAGGDAVGLSFSGGDDLIQSNSLIGVGWPLVLMGCTYGWADCMTAANTVYEDNVSLGYTSSNYNSGGTPFAFYSSNLFITSNYNEYYRMTNIGTLGANDITTNPLFSGQPDPTIVLSPSTESVLDNYNFNLTSSSGGKWAGTSYAGMSSTDQGNTAWHSPPSMGGREFSGISTVATPTFLPVAGTYVGTQSVAISTTTSGASIIWAIDPSVPIVTALTCTITNGTLYTGPLTVATSTTINAIGCLTGDDASSLATAAYTINAATGGANVTGGKAIGVVIQ